MRISLCNLRRTGTHLESGGPVTLLKVTRSSRVVGFAFTSPKGPQRPEPLRDPVPIRPAQVRACSSGPRGDSQQTGASIQHLHPVPHTAERILQLFQVIFHLNATFRIGVGEDLSASLTLEAVSATLRGSRSRFQRKTRRLPTAKTPGDSSTPPLPGNLLVPRGEGSCNSEVSRTVEDYCPEFLSKRDNYRAVTTEQYNRGRFILATLPTVCYEDEGYNG